MDLHPSSTSTSAPTPITKGTGTTLASQEVASSTHNAKSNTEREVIVDKVNEPAAGTVSDRSTLLRLLSSLQRLMENYDDLNFLPSLYAQL